METKHTPGPWILMTVPTSVGSCHKIGPFPSAGARPETMACIYADGVRPGIDENNAAALELKANALLIAAAPELLEALIAYSKAYDENPHLGPRGSAVDLAFAKARDVIAKATDSA